MEFHRWLHLSDMLKSVYGMKSVENKAKSVRQVFTIGYVVFKYFKNTTEFAFRDSQTAEGDTHTHTKCVCGAASMFTFLYHFLRDACTHALWVVVVFDFCKHPLIYNL